MLTRRSVLAGAAIAAAAPASRAAHAAAPVRVASKQDTEGGLLGHVVLALLAARKIPTVDRLQLGVTSIVRNALLAGEVDLYPEYTGNGAFFFNSDSDPAWKDAHAGWEKVRKLDADAHGIAWLAPAPANNTWGLAVRADAAKANGLRTLEDFARWANGGGKVRLAASAEFTESAAALPAFQQAYGFKLGREQLLVLAGGDTAATERAAAEGTSGVNACMAYGTDGALDALDLVLLDDPKAVQMVYAPAPTVRRAVLADYPQIADALAPAFAALDGATLRHLNASIAVDGEEPAAVARKWLGEKGLLR